MSVLRRLLLRLYNLLRPGRAERRLEREVTSHLALLEERFRAQGLPPDDARLAARRAFGGVEQAKELQRDARSFAWLEDARRDLLYAVRTLAATPGFTFVAVLTLALGIGAVTVIYSIINNVLFDPLPYPNADRFVNVFVEDTETGFVRGVFSPSEFLDYQDGADVFGGVVGTRTIGMTLTAREGAEFLRAVWVTPNFFEFMGLPPLIGRSAGSEDGAPGAPPVAVLRHRAWVTYFGADPGIVGKTIVLNGEPRTVIGVMPPRFTWHAADVWMPKPIDRTAADAGTVSRNFQARLKPGVTIGEAEAQLNLIAARRAREHPDQYPKKFHVQVVNVIEYTVGRPFSTVLYVTLAAVGLLLLIACCNVANMLLARATVREREMTVRAALGAGRFRIVRQLLVESLLLGFTGAAAGCLLAYVGLDALIAVLPVAPLPGEVEIALDGAALGVSLATAVVSALLFGIAPALYSARRDLVEGLKGGGKGLAGGRGRLRNGLVAAEVALSLVLLLGAGLLMRTFLSLTGVDLGFDPGKILFAPVAFAPGTYTAPEEKRRFYEQALQRIAALPGVDAVSASTAVPPGGAPRSELEIPGRSSGDPSTAIVQSCTEGCFRTLGIRILRGRGLPALSADGVPRTGVVNQTFVSSYFRDEDPIGQHVRITSPGAMAGSFEIVGVVEDVKNQGIKGVTVPHVYLPGATALGSPVILIRAQADPIGLLNSVRHEIARVDPNVALVQPRSLEDLLERFTYAQPRFSLIVLGIFAVLGTLLVAIGVFSVMAYTVSRQTKEIAVRVALGAGRGDVLRVVFGLGARLIAAGAVVGLVASFATNRLIANQLWNTSPHDPLTFAAATSAIAIVALAACYIPARRAMRIDPMVALRQE